MDKKPPTTAPPKILYESTYNPETWARVRTWVNSFNWGCIGAILLCLAVWTVVVILTMWGINKFS